MPCITDAGRGRTHAQRPPGISDRGFSDPKAGIVTHLVRHFAQATLECFGKLARGGNTDGDRLARVIEQGYFRRIIPIIEYDFSCRVARCAAAPDRDGSSPRQEAQRMAT